MQSIIHVLQKYAWQFLCNNIYKTINTCHDKSKQALWQKSAHSGQGITIREFQPNCILIKYLNLQQHWSRWRSSDIYRNCLLLSEMLLPPSYRATTCGLACRKEEGLWILKTDLPCTQISIIPVKRFPGRDNSKRKNTTDSIPACITWGCLNKNSEDVGYLVAVFSLNNENIHNPSCLDSLTTPLAWLHKPTLQMLLTWLAVALSYFSSASTRNRNLHGCGNSHKLPSAYFRAMKYSCRDFFKELLLVTCKPTSQTRTCSEPILRAGRKHLMIIVLSAAHSPWHSAF